MIRSAVHIRDATTADLPALLALEAGFPGDRLSRRQFRYHLRRAAPLRVAEIDNVGVVGYYLLFKRADSSGARLYSIVVDPSRRGLGLGSSLLQAAEQHATALGADALTLEVRADNPQAISLYRRHGYRAVGQRGGYYDDGADALVLRRALRDGRG